jgi:hypothetical protein
LSPFGQANIPPVQGIAAAQSGSASRRVAQAFFKTSTDTSGSVTQCPSMLSGLVEFRPDVEWPLCRHADAESGTIFSGEVLGVIDHMPNTIDVIVGYLITLADGFQCRLGPDLARAQNYATQQHARSLEPMFVRRFKPDSLP